MTTKRHMTSESIPLTTTTTTEFIPPTSTSPMLSSLTPTPSPSPSRWLTPEFGIYYVILGYCLYFGTQLVANISEKLNTGEISSRGLQKGWIGDRHIDLRDQQYAFFRDNLALLTGAAIIFLLISHGVRRINSSLRFRMTFYFIIALGFIIFLNGTSSIFMMTIVTFNYLVTSFIITSKASVVFTWVYACFILLVNERYRGYRWSELMGPTWSTWDEYHGLFPWHILFNLVILRMISFNMDYHWFSTARSLTDPSGIIISFEKHTVKCHECRIRGERDACTWWREKAHRTKEEYNYMYYIAYLFYPPLHLAGPTTTYNSFISHITSSQKTYTHRDLIMYIIRLLFAIMIMEIVLHYLYVFVITGSDLYKTLTPTEVSMISYWTLHTMWLKFLILWRFFRTWALLDGVEAPENMNRCMSNNYSVEGFWRSWHRSFNRWLVRYIYVPLGGRGPSTSPLKSVQDGRSSGGLARLMRRIVNTFITFTFVAFWHDRTMQLLAWGWLIALIFVPELTASSIANLKRFKSIRESWYWRHIRASGAALNIFLMMLINLIGYSVGVSGTTTILATLFTPGNGSLLCLIFAVFFSAAQIMFEVRQQEIRTALAQGKAANIEY